MLVMIKMVRFNSKKHRKSSFKHYSFDINSVISFMNTSATKARSIS